MPAMGKNSKADERRDELARRILRTPPLPRDAYKIGKPKPSKGKSPAKRTRGKGRVRVGRSTD
jgi:hypothetical protein